MQRLTEIHMRLAVIGLHHQAKIELRDNFTLPHPKYFVIYFLFFFLFIYFHFTIFFFGGSFSCFLPYVE